MDKKQYYVRPFTESVEIVNGGSVLSGSAEAETLTKINGTWDEE